MRLSCLTLLVLLLPPALGCIRLVSPAQDAGVTVVDVRNVAVTPGRQAFLPLDQRTTGVAGFGADTLEIYGTGWDPADVVVTVGGKQLDRAGPVEGGMAYLLTHDTPDGTIEIRSRNTVTRAPVKFHQLGPGHIEDPAYAGNVSPPVTVLAAGGARSPCPTDADFPDGGAPRLDGGAIRCDGDTPDGGPAGLAVAFSLSAQDVDRQAIEVAVMRSVFDTVAVVNHVRTLVGVVSQEVLAAAPIWPQASAAVVLQRDNDTAPVDARLVDSANGRNDILATSGDLTGPVFYMGNRDNGVALVLEQPCTGMDCNWRMGLVRPGSAINWTTTFPGGLRAVGLVDATLTRSSTFASHALVGVSCSGPSNTPTLHLHRVRLDNITGTILGVDSEMAPFANACGSGGCGSLLFLCADERVARMDPLAPGVWVRNNPDAPRFDESGLVLESPLSVEPVLPSHHLAARTVVRQPDGTRVLLGVNVGTATNSNQRRAELVRWRPNSPAELVTTRVPYAHLLPDPLRDVVYAIPEGQSPQVDVLGPNGQLLVSRSVLGTPQDVFVLPPSDGRMIVLLPSLALLTDVNGRVLRSAPASLEGALAQTDPWRPVPSLVWSMAGANLKAYCLTLPEQDAECAFGDEHGDILLTGAATHQVAGVSPHAVILQATDNAGRNGDPQCRQWLRTVRTENGVVRDVEGTCGLTPVSYESIHEVLFAVGSSGTHLVTMDGNPRVVPDFDLPAVRKRPGSIVLLPNGSGIGFFSPDNTGRVELGVFDRNHDYSTLDADPAFPEGVLALSPDGRRLYISQDGVLTEYLVDGLWGAGRPNLRPGSRVAIGGRPSRLRLDISGRRMAYVDPAHETVGIVE